MCCGVQSAKGKFVVSNSPNQEFRLEDSSMMFHNWAQMKLSCAILNLIRSSFVGNGTIDVGRGPEFSLVDKAYVLVNTFYGVQLDFNGKPTLRDNVAIIQLRNNRFLKGSKLTGGLNRFRCDAAGSGFEAGCDIRSICTAPDDEPNDVQCNCLSPLRFRSGSLKDGSECEVDGQALYIFQTGRTFSAVVRKPRNLMLPLAVIAQSEVSFNVTFHTPAAYLVVDSTGSRQYEMSRRNSEKTKHFSLTVLGQYTNWSDSETKKAFVHVSALHATKTGNEMTTVEISLAPYGSCQHTSVSIKGIDAPLTHLRAHVMLVMVAKDSDGLLISKTPFNTQSNTRFNLSLVYKGESTQLNIVRDALNGSQYSATVPLPNLRRQGTYQVKITMENAWDEREQNVTSCVPDAWKQTTFEVSCDPGYQPSTTGCVEEGMSTQSNVVQLIVGGLVGALFAAGLLSLFQYARQDPERFKKLIVSFLMNEVTSSTQLNPLNTQSPANR